MSWVLLAINLATSRETGVASITISEIFQFIESIKMSVPIMVKTPENNCLKPIRRPSAKVSTSLMTLLKTSPVLWVSIIDNGTFEIFKNAFFLISRITLYVILLFISPEIH